MQKLFLRILVIVGILAGIFVFAGISKADELTDVVTDLSNAGINEAAIGSLLSGPSDTLGQRVGEMLKSGAITQRQYDIIYNKFINLPAEKRQAIKNEYQKDPSKLYNITRKGVARRLDANDDASVRDHIKDLKRQGLTKEQIQARLKNEGVSAQKLKDLGYGIPDNASRVGHLKDNRYEEGVRDKTRRAVDNRKDVRQGNVDSGKAWWKFWEQDKPQAVEKARTNQPARARAKDARDNRRR